MSAIAAALAVWCTGAVIDARLDDAMGPHPADAAALARAKSVHVLEHEHVRFECRSAADTGVVWVEGKRGRETRTPIWAVPCGDRVLLVKSSSLPAGPIDGTLRPVESSVMWKFNDEERRVLLPFVLEEGDPRVLLWIAFAALAAGTAWLAFATVRSLRRTLDPAQHPALKRLAGDGHFPKVAAQVESELAAPGALRHRGRVFTRTFVIDRRLARFDVRRWRDVVWAYKQSTQHSYWFIPTGKSHELRLHFSDGARMFLSSNWTHGKAASEEAVDEALRFAWEHAPWAFAGYDPAIDRAWRKERAALSAAVATRRAEIGEAAAESAQQRERP